MKRIFPAVKLRPQTPPIDEREIGDAAIPRERRIHTSPSASPPPPTRAICQWACSLEWRCTFWSGKFASVSFYSIVKACSTSSIMTLWGKEHTCSVFDASFFECQVRDTNECRGRGWWYTFPGVLHSTY